MKVTIKMEGLREVDDALRELIDATSSRTARAALKRGLVVAAKPIQAAAKRLVPVQSGRLRDAIIIEAAAGNTVGKAEFAKVLKSGGTKAEATAALRDARRGSNDPTAGLAASVSVGVDLDQAFYGNMVEYGTAHARPHPYMRPAWESEKENAPEGIKTAVAAQLAKGIARAKSKAMK